MSRVNRIPAAFKHGAYAATTVLPGEDPAAFEKLHRDLIAEFGPNGALENDIVATLARLLWRKQNLETFRIAELARARNEQIWSEKVPTTSILDFPLFDDKTTDPTEYKAAIRAAKDQARTELGYTYEFVEIVR